MSIINALYPQGDFLNIRANAPTQADYNVRATEDLVRNLPGGVLRDILAPAAAATLSLPYDTIQGISRANSYTPSGIMKAIAAENPLSSAYERFMGASAPLAERLSNLDLLGNFGFGTPAAASEVSIEEPLDAEDFLGTSTPSEISIPEAPKIFSPAQEFNFLPSAYEDETLFEEEPRGIAKLFKTIGDIYSKLPTPMNLIRSIGENFGKGPTYSRFSPGGTFRGGIYNIGGVNTPIQLANDFYDRTTGLNRFDRAAERFKRTGSMADLFASSRTGKEFFEKRRQIQAQKQKALEDAAKAKIQFKQDTGGGGGGGGGSYTPSVSASQAAANREGRRGGQYR